jgi:hypothetical protein
MKPRRFLDRRHDPLKVRSLADWQAAFARFRVVTDAVIVAGRKVAWDYPYTRPVTEQFSNLYHRLENLPPLHLIRKALLRLGYHPRQAYRSTVAYCSMSRYGSTTEINAMGRKLSGLIGATHQDKEPDSGEVEIHLAMGSESPSSGDPEPGPASREGKLSRACRAAERRMLRRYQAQARRQPRGRPARPARRRKPLPPASPDVVLSLGKGSGCPNVPLQPSEPA